MTLYPLGKPPRRVKSHRQLLMYSDEDRAPQVADARSLIRYVKADAVGRVNSEV